MTVEEFNNLKENDILYTYSFKYIIVHTIEKIDYVHGKKYIIMNNDHYYDEEDCLCFYISEEKCKLRI